MTSVSQRFGAEVGNSRTGAWRGGRAWGERTRTGCIRRRSRWRTSRGGVRRGWGRPRTRRLGRDGARRGDHRRRLTAPVRKSRRTCGRRRGWARGRGGGVSERAEAREGTRARPAGGSTRARDAERARTAPPAAATRDGEIVVVARREGGKVAHRTGSASSCGSELGTSGMAPAERPFASRARVLARRRERADSGDASSARSCASCAPPEVLGDQRRTRPARRSSCSETRGRAPARANRHTPGRSSP